MSKKIPEDKKDMARLLLARGASYREIAASLSMSIGSVHSIAKEPFEELKPLLDEIKKRSAIKYSLLSDHILNRISDINIIHASLKDKVIAAAILMDKARLIEGNEQNEQGKEENAFKTVG